MVRRLCACPGHLKITCLETLNKRTSCISPGNRSNVAYNTFNGGRLFYRYLYLLLTPPRLSTFNIFVILAMAQLKWQCGILLLHFLYQPDQYRANSYDVLVIEYNTPVPADQMRCQRRYNVDSCNESYKIVEYHAKIRRKTRITFVDHSSNFWNITGQFVVHSILIYTTWCEK